MRTILEFKPKKRIWVIWPSLIFFLYDAEGSYTDLTLSWLCVGVTLRWNEK